MATSTTLYQPLIPYSPVLNNWLYVPWCLLVPPGTVLSSEWPSLTPHCKDAPSFFAEGTLFSSWYFILKAIIFIYLPVYCVPAPLNNKLRAVGPSLVSDTEILKMNEWSMKTAHQWKLLSMVPGTEHEPEWINSSSTTHPPLTTFASVLSQATAQLDRQQKAQ